MPLIRRARGTLLRLARRRRLSIVVGVSLVVPSVWVEFIARDVVWWLEGLSLVVGATGVALIWSGLTGTNPDWIE